MTVTLIDDCDCALHDLTHFAYYNHYTVRNENEAIQLWLDLERRGVLYYSIHMHGKHALVGY